MRGTTPDVSYNPKSAAFREGPLTLEDYDEAIQNLTDARRQIAAGELWRGCGYCGSEEHQPDACRHNILAIARRLVGEKAANALWRCYHCCATFASADILAARLHFGLTSAALPVCVTDALKRASVRWVEGADEDGNRALVFELAEVAEGNEQVPGA